jgi:hypothetical protein
MPKREPAGGLRRFMSHEQWVARMVAERFAINPTLKDRGRQALTAAARQADVADGRTAPQARSNG